MRPRMICLHASQANIELVECDLKGLPFDLQHEVDATLLTMIRAQQPLHKQQQYVQKKLTALIALEPALIFITCTNYIALLDIFPFTSPIPILKIDEVLFEQLKEPTNPIQLLFTNEKTVAGTMKRLRHVLGHEALVEVICIPEAFDWYLQGDMLKHDRRVLDVLLQLEPHEHTIAVAQLSMSRIAAIYSKLSGNFVMSPSTALRSYMMQLIH